MIKHLYEYKSTLRETRKRQKELKEIEEPTPEDKKDIKLYGEIITSLEYVIRWLEEGHEPYPHRTMKNDSWGGYSGGTGFGRIGISVIVSFIGQGIDQKRKASSGGSIEPINQKAKGRILTAQGRSTFL